MSKFFSFSIVLLSSVATASTAFAQKPDIYGGSFFQDSSGRFSLMNFINQFLPETATKLAGLLAALAVLFLIVAGIQYLLSGGDPEKITKATKTTFYVLAGMILVMFSYALIYLFLTIFSATS